MPRLIHSNPKYRKHRASGQAIVTIDGKDFYLGLFGTKASKTEYDRLIGEWLANGRRMNAVPGIPDMSIAELLHAFWQHAQTYYRKPDGTTTSEIDNLKDAMRPLRRLYGAKSVSEFGPLSLKALIQEMIKLGWCRTYINRQLSRIKHIFKWGVGSEMVPASIFHGLQAVGGLRAGRSDAKESTPVEAAGEQHIGQVLPHLSRHIQKMIELQLLTGMRPGEVCAMRAADIEMSGKLWLYCPATHKTAHHGHRRVIYLGPKAQELIKPFLKPNLAAHLFSPADAEAERRAALHAARKTPPCCGNVPGSNRKRKPRREPGDRYTVESYSKAVLAACDKEFPLPDELARKKGESAKDWRSRLTPEGSEKVKAWRREHRWHPHQLRHTAATRLRKEFGLDAAQVILGHKTLTVTQVYAEKNLAKAQQIMAEVG